MFFSKTCEYAIRAVLFIAQKSEEGKKTGIREIAAGISSPEHFIAKILQDLSRKGLIKSSKGPNGGFYVDQTARNHTLADIVKAVDSDKIFTACGLGLDNCSETKPCPLHNEFKQIRKQMHSVLKSAKIGEFNDNLKKGLNYLGER